MNKKSVPKLLTEVELELMSVLWNLGAATVHDVQGGLAKHRKLAYTSVSTILRILEQKGVVESRKEGRGHVYIPRLSKGEYEAKSLGHLVKRVFDNSPTALVRRLVDEGKLSSADLSELRALIEEKLS